MTEDIYTCDGLLDEELVPHSEGLRIYLDRELHSGIGATRELQCKVEVRNSNATLSFSICANDVKLCVYPQLKLNLKFHYDLDLMQALAGACMTDQMIELFARMDVHYYKYSSSSSTSHDMKIAALSEHQTDINSHESLHSVGEKYIHVTLELA